MTNKPSFLTIGYITQDVLPDGSFAPGGTVTFAARLAHGLGEQAAIVTAAPSRLRQLPLFEGISIVGPDTEPIATTFENIYYPTGRQQFVRAVAPPITAQDVPPEWLQTPVVLLGPVAGECTDELFELFKNSLVGLTPQGFMREWDGPTGLVQPIEWAAAARLLPSINALILSSEDLPPGPRGEQLLTEYARLCPLVVCTLNRDGCKLYQNGQAEHFPAHPVEEINPTGAGDVFATAFLLHLNATGQPDQAARFANATAAKHIEGL